MRECRLSHLLLLTVFLCSGLIYPTRSSRAEEIKTQTAAAQPEWMKEYSQLSISELVNLEVTSASKKSERKGDVASAIHVITNDDIRRSGARTVPDALRMVPGLDVASVDNSQWAVSSRGFNGLFSDKLLVLIDGRSVYTPLFGGVFWNTQDLMLEDIDRIEVIRGPGATLWGANAVNGVINIITKSAEDTQGSFISGGGGNEEQGTAAVRYGGESGDTAYRVYSKSFIRDDSELTRGGKAADEWKGIRTGFRSDTELSSDQRLTVQGDVYYGESGWNLLLPDLQTFQESEEVTRYYSGENILARWNQSDSPDHDLMVQFFYDRIQRNDRVLIQERDTFDLEVQHRFSPLEGHDLIYGFGSRVYRDHIRDGTFFNVGVEPSNRNVDLYTGFIQDEISLIEEELRLIVGVKLEHNEFSDLEVLPNVRTIYTPNDTHTFWGAFSGAVRSPTRFNHDGRLVLNAFPGEGGVTNIVTLEGDRGYDAEDLFAYEAGYRAQLLDNFSIDLATFFNVYDDLESAEPAAAPFLDTSGDIPFVEIPFIVDNKLEGETFGVEVALDYRPVDYWRLVGYYAFLKIDLSRTEGSQDTIFLGGENQSPEHQYHLRSQFDLPYNLEFDSEFRYVSSIGTFEVDSYYELNLRLGARLSPQWEVSILAHDLLDSSHLEFASNLVDTEQTEVERGVYGKVSYRF